jgi:hypothetical protein
MEHIKQADGTIKNVYSEAEKEELESGRINGTRCSLRDIFVYCEAFGYDFYKFIDTYELASL